MTGCCAWLGAGQAKLVSSIQTAPKAHFQKHIVFILTRFVLMVETELATTFYFSTSPSWLATQIHSPLFFIHVSVKRP